MNLSELIKKPRIETRVFPDLEGVTIHAKRLKAGRMAALMDMKDKTDSNVAAILGSICDENGNAAFASAEEVKALDHDIYMELVNFVTEINVPKNLMDDGAKNSRAPQS